MQLIWKKQMFIPPVYVIYSPIGILASQKSNTMLQDPLNKKARFYIFAVTQQMCTLSPIRTSRTN